MKPNCEINVPLPGNKTINIKVTTNVKLSWDDVEAAWEGLQLETDNTTEPVRACDNCAHGRRIQEGQFAECDCFSICGDPLLISSDCFVSRASDCHRYKTPEIETPSCDKCAKAIWIDDGIKAPSVNLYCPLRRVHGVYRSGRVNSDEYERVAGDCLQYTSKEG